MFEAAHIKLAANFSKLFLSNISLFTVLFTADVGFFFFFFLLVISVEVDVDIHPAS